MTDLQVLKDLFKKYFPGEPSLVVRAPGRINLIGEHTDYNDGFVLPVAIRQSVWIACRVRQDGEILCHSTGFEGPLTFLLGRMRRERGHWGEYIKGVAWALLRSGYDLCGWEGALHGDIPIGAGLASSAAIEVASLRAFASLSEIIWEPIRMAKLGQRAETDWVGVDSGIMDQMISVMAQPGEALLIDCRTLDFQSIPIPANLALLALDTGTRRDLVGSTYNQRHQECAHAAEQLGVRALRDLTFDEFRTVERILDDVLRRRARHVITENERTLLAAKALEEGEVVKLGELIDESHQSLRDDYEVSSPELDMLTSIAREQEGCYGARMTGAGFGGFALALVERDFAGSFVERVENEYLETTGLATRVLECEPCGGVEVVYEASSR